MDEPQQSDPTQSLSALFTEDKKEEEHEDFFLFELDDAFYAVPVEAVEQVLRIPPITTVPNAPEAIIGIFHLRGKVIVALDPLKRMGLTRKSSFVPNYLFVTHKDRNYFAILVDRVRNVVKVNASELIPVDPVTQTHFPEKYATHMFMHSEAARLGHKNVPDFLIRKNSGAGDEAVEEKSPAMPVIILNVAMILDQNDLLSIGAAHGATLGAAEA